MRRFASLIAWLAIALPAFADGPGDNIADKVRPIPPKGIDLDPEVRAELQEGVEQLGKTIQILRQDLTKKPAFAALIPDVEIYRLAVHYAVKHGEIFRKEEIPVAKKLLEQGQARAKELAEGKPSWPTQTGLVVRGYVSKIDNSVQPYGLVVPVTWNPKSAVKHRLDFWFHGRGENLSELNFIDGRQKSPGEFAPANAFVLHPYGRYCNANHFAGEVDTLEALEHAKKHYSIDENRLVVRGFSMGGAACWNFAVHYSSKWAAAAPGAGFSETPDFLRVFQKETIHPNEWQRKLLRMYDCNDWVLNLTNVPTVAYSGEKDNQKQAADVMVKAAKSIGMNLVHVIGPGTGHSYHPAAKVEINRRIDALAEAGRSIAPSKVRMTTYTLRYPRQHWVQVEGMEEHWQQATVNATLVVETANNEDVAKNIIDAKTKNVDRISFVFQPGEINYFDLSGKTVVRIDGQDVEASGPESDYSLHVTLEKTKGKWALATADAGLRKRPGLQGPIDDAFMDRFIMVRPTGKPLNDKVGTWAKEEMEHRLVHWRRQFRGEAIVKDDAKIDDADIASSNLALWGDPSSNAVLARIADKLPIKWNGQEAIVAGKIYTADKHVPVLIYPNPLNPKKYVVLNSAFTYREYDYLNNARQIPRLPDWAVFDVDQPRTSQQPAGIAIAGFFNERWEFER
ncbi:MAG: prolyl oligopeptidase family serine peptidase [Gemmataceae bacterium]|nr:prolyl oligopeptidase family serine peptidase [Gemmataceae bacterium]